MEEEIPKFFGTPGERVPQVSFADLKAAWVYSKEVAARHPGESVAIGIGAWKHVLSPGANMPAIAYRHRMLALLNHTLAAAWPGGHMTDAALKAAAEMDLTWMEVGKVYKGAPFDVWGFLVHVGNAESK